MFAASASLSRYYLLIPSFICFRSRYVVQGLIVSFGVVDSAFSLALMTVIPPAELKISKPSLSCQPLLARHLLNRHTLIASKAPIPPPAGRCSALLANGPVSNGGLLIPLNFVRKGCRQCAGLQAIVRLVTDGSRLFPISGAIGSRISPEPFSHWASFARWMDGPRAGVRIEWRAHAAKRWSLRRRDT
jgi:hypothetical protein